MYKINFILSIVFIILLFSFYVYAEYDRNKSEEVSQEMLANLNEISKPMDIEVIDNTTISSNDNVWIVALDGDNNYNVPEQEENDNESVVEQNEITTIKTDETQENIQIEDTYYAPNGKKYTMVGTINIPLLDVSYPILSETTDKLLKISVCKFWGCNPNEVGNLCIAGHNYRNSKFFSKIPTLKIGDTIEITDVYKKKLNYSIYDKYTVDPADVSCTSQLTGGKKVVTLITCTDDSKQRWVLKAKEI